MKNIWKWILGILIVLAILAIPAALYYMYTHYSSFVTAGTLPGFRGPVMGGHGYDWNHPHMHNDFRFGEGFKPMHRRGHFTPFFGGFFLLFGLLKIALFGALLYGAYWLGKRNARITLDPAPVPAPMKPDNQPAPRPRKAARS
jgi:hypothetical protein